MLEHIFGSRTRLKLLQLFLAHPEKSYYVRELSRLAGVQLNAVRREISNLERIGLVGPITFKKDYPEGGERCKYYQMKSDSMLYPEFKELIAKVQVLEEREFVEQLKKRGGKILFLLLTGYFTGEKHVESDLLIVGTVKPAIVAKLVKDFEKNIGRELRYTVMTDVEFNDRREIGDKFLYSMLEAKHITAVDEYQLVK